jgi:glycine betaine/proline transport system permease protein
MRLPIEYVLLWINQGLTAVPPGVLIAALALIGAWRRGWAFGLFAGCAAFAMGWLGLWAASLTSVSVVATSVVFAALIGLPTGILLAESEIAWRIAKPALDVMQTTPSFVYLVPVVMLFGIGTVPGAIATLVFATPPLIKLTYLGLVKVPVESTEAGLAFGATRRQLLLHVKLPLALDTIRAGLNQTIMLAIVMSSIAAMIGAEGLGLVVLRGIARLDVGMAATGGMCLVLLALTMDGLTHSRGAHAPPGVLARISRMLRPTPAAAA